MPAEITRARQVTERALFFFGKADAGVGLPYSGGRAQPEAASTGTPNPQQPYNQSLPDSGSKRSPAGCDMPATIHAVYPVAGNGLPSRQSAFDSRRPLQFRCGLVERIYGAFIPRRTKFNSWARYQNSTPRKRGAHQGLSGMTAAGLGLPSGLAASSVSTPRSLPTTTKQRRVARSLPLRGLPTRGPMDLDVDRVIASVTGHQIVGGDVGEGGLHLQLDDGRVLIFTGVFVVALVEIGRATIQ